jgi:hypothetical protein
MIKVRQHGKLLFLMFEKIFIGVLSLVPDSLVPGNPYSLWISIGINDKHMDNFESQNSIIGETSV